MLPLRSAGPTAITTTVTESQTHTVFVAVEAATQFTSFVPINGLPAGGTRPKLTSAATSSTAAVTESINGLPVAGPLTVTPGRTQTTSFPTTTMPVPYGYYAPSSSATVASPTGNKQGMIQETSHKRTVTPSRANAITQGSKSTFTSCAKAYPWPGVYLSDSNPPKHEGSPQHHKRGWSASIMQCAGRREYHGLNILHQAFERCGVAAAGVVPAKRSLCLVNITIFTTISIP